jgi:hypothetical protein
MVDLNPLKERIELALANLLHEPNDSMLRHMAQNEAVCILREAQARREVSDFRVTCDETNNIHGSDELRVDVYLKPGFSVNILVWNFAIVFPTVPIDYEVFRGELLVMCEG